MENDINNKKVNYFIRLFKGQISLPMTYWVWFLFLNFLITITSSFYFNSLPIEPSSIQRKIVLSIVFLTFLYSILILISVWRSATNHDDSKVWAIVAKIIVIINFINLMSELYATSKVFLNKEIALINQIKSINQRAPIKVAEDIYITKAVIDNKNIYYTYRLNKITEEKFSTFNISLLNDDVEKASCNDVEIKKLLEKNYKFNYYYTNKENKMLTNIEIKKETCIRVNKDKDILKSILKQEKKQKENLSI